MSLSLKCYISIATLKRAELGKSISRRTLNKLVKFFDIEPDVLLYPETPQSGKSQGHFKPILQPVVINWDLLWTLPDTQEHEYINFICSELHASLMKLNHDEMLCRIFAHQVK